MGSKSDFDWGQQVQQTKAINPATVDRKGEIPIQLAAR